MRKAHVKGQFVLGTQGERFWIIDGEVLPPARDIELSDIAENERFERRGGVRVTTGPLGTEIKWSVFSPSFASLHAAMRWIDAANAPFILRYYLSGWFEEKCNTNQEARNRIDQVMAKSELRILSRAFVQEASAVKERMPPMLQRSWSSVAIIPEISIDCTFDQNMQRFRVDRVGPQSTIARFYGIVPVTYPFVNGGSYDDVVCAAYKEVLDTGKARYDHVLAAMRMPNNVIHWVPYQRMIVPKQQSQKASVTVVTEIAPVDISLV